MMMKKKGCKDTEFSHDGKCVVSCPEGTVANDKKVCVGCKENEFIHQGKCVVSCPEGTVANDKVCVPFDLRNKFIIIDVNQKSLAEKFNSFINSSSSSSMTELVQAIDTFKRSISDMLSLYPSSSVKTKIDTLFEGYKKALYQVILDENTPTQTDSMRKENLIKFGQEYINIEKAFREDMPLVWWLYIYNKLSYDLLDRIIKNGVFTTNVSAIEINSPEKYIDYENGTFIIKDNKYTTYLNDLRNRDVKNALYLILPKDNQTSSINRISSFFKM
jgi:hypothetical protein